MYVSQTSYVADMCSCARKRTYSRVLIKSSTHVIQIIVTKNNSFLPCQVLSQHLLTMPCNPDDQTLERKAYYSSTFFAFRFYPIVSFSYILHLDVHSTWSLATNPKNGHHKDQGACWIIKQHSRHDHYIIKINNLHLTTQTVATLR